MVKSIANQRSLPAPPLLTTMVEAVAAEGGQPETAFEALAYTVKETLEVRLFTVMELDHQRNLARRSYSNQPAAYPVSGEKPIEQNRWTEQVAGRHEIFVANTIAAIAEVFPDHEHIASLGCESCLNLPIVVAGNMLGTMNFLDVAGFFTDERIAVAQSLKPAGVMALLLADHVRHTH